MVKRALATILIALALGCVPQPLDQPLDPMSFVQLRVINNNWLQARIYVLRGGEKHRLALVTSREKLRIDASYFQGSPPRIYVTLLADRFNTWLSGELYWVRPGDCILIRINALLSTSSVNFC